MSATRWITVTVGCGAILTGAAAYSGTFGAEAESGRARPLEIVGSAAALTDARRACTVAALDAFIERQRVATAGGTAADWRVLAEAYLERAHARGQRRGIAVGRPLYAELPGAVRQDLDLGDAALMRARELGDASSESYRIEAALATGRVTGLMSALRAESQVRGAIDTAARLDPSNPRVKVSIACRKMFRPIGGDPAGALEDFLAAAEAMPADERPLVFASMAATLIGEPAQALALCQRAVERNPNNVYAGAVLGRLERGEANPFGRDVSDAELVK